MTTFWSHCLMPMAMFWSHYWVQIKGTLSGLREENSKLGRKARDSFQKTQLWGEFWAERKRKQHLLLFEAITTAGSSKGKHSHKYCVSHVWDLERIKGVKWWFWITCDHCTGPSSILESQGACRSWLLVTALATSLPAVLWSKPSSTHSTVHNQFWLARSKRRNLNEICRSNKTHN